MNINQFKIVRIMNYHLYVPYRPEVSGRWLKYRLAGVFDLFKDAGRHGDMILDNNLADTVRYRIS